MRSTGTKEKWPQRIGDFIYRYRWLIGLAVVCLAVLFKLSGSSIGIWQAHITDPAIASDGVLLGQNREIRTDEWAVHTPMTLAQYEDGFPVFGNILRAGSTDMYMVYGQPVSDWSIVFRPFQLGYLFLSPARGLAFYWTAKLVMLVLVSFEMGMLITQRRKLLSLTYAVFIAFSPVVQWWFGTNFFPDMLVYGQGIVLCVAVYMQSEQYWRRVLCALGVTVCGGAYLLVMYPAWQIPFFWLFLLLGVWVIVSRWKEFSFSAGKDIPIIAGSIVLLAVGIGLIVWRSWDTITAVMNSVYPGERTERGGGGLSVLFQYPGNLFLPFSAKDLLKNQSEMAVFFDLFPLGGLISLIVLYRNRMKDKLLITLWIGELFLGTYVVLGFPNFVSKLLLLSNSQTPRAFIALSFLNVMLLFRALALWETGVRKRAAVPLALLLAAAVTYYSQRLIYEPYLTVERMAIIVAVLVILFFSALGGGRMRTIFCVAGMLVLLVVNGQVNPLRTGLDVIENNRLGQAIRQQQQEDAGNWIAVNDEWIAGNYLAMNGAPTLNSTNTYCNWEMWEKLDPEGIYADIYNRYAHISIVLETGDTPTTLELPYADQILLRLNVNDLDLLNVDYIVTADELDGLQTEDGVIRLIYAEPDMSRRIYRVEYEEAR